MKNKLGIMVAVVVVVVLAAYMFTFQVRYDENAVLTTFEKAGEGAVKKDAGLYFQLPWPIQNVHKYSTKLQVLDEQLEQVQTADNYVVVIRTYLTWRVTDPAQFFASLRTPEEARKQLQPYVRDFAKTFGKYRFDQYVNTDPSKLALEKIEKEVLDEVNAKLANTSYGLKVEHVGIRRVVLPETVTQKVFTRMNDTRQRLAQNARSAGTAQATAIRSEAETAQKTIEAFAQSRASAIKAEGVSQAAVYMDAFKKDESFAIFLRQVEALKTILSHNTTFVLDNKSVTPFELFDNKARGTASSK